MEGFSNPININEGNKESKKSKYILVILLILIFLLIIFLIIIVILYIKLNQKINEYTNLLNEYKKIQNDFNQQKISLNNIFDIFQSLISKNEITHSKIKRSDYLNSKLKINSTKNFSDGTYNFTTKEIVTFEKGYQIAFETKSKNANNYYSDDEFDDMVYKMAILTEGNPYIGVFDNNPEISFYVENKNLSLAFAALFNQKSIWDWSINNILLNPFFMEQFYYIKYIK